MSTRPISKQASKALPKTQGADQRVTKRVVTSQTITIKIRLISNKIFRCPLLLEMSEYAFTAQIDSGA